MGDGPMTITVRTPAVRLARHGPKNSDATAVLMASAIVTIVLVALASTIATIVLMSTNG